MKIVEQSWSWMQKPSNQTLQLIEQAGRTCYKSEKPLTTTSSEKFVKMLRDRGHHSVIEHVNASVKFITNRGVTHELVRHRLCAFSQESTRYVNYGGKEIEMIKPVWWNTSDVDARDTWIHAIQYAELGYNDLLKFGWRPEQAREVLPNSLKTEIVVTANMREWRHIFTLRTSKAAHPQIRELMQSCLEGFQKLVPVLFDDIGGE